MRKRTATHRLTLIVTYIALVVTPVMAAPHEVRLPLRDSRLHTPDLAAAVCRELRLPPINIIGGDINLATLRGSLCVRGFNAAMGDGCRVTVDRDSIVLRVDPEKLPAHVDDFKRAIRVFTSEVAPDAAAAQARHWGIFLPDHVDPRRPLVLLIHGLGSEKEDLFPMSQLLSAEGYQVGYFAYPADQPIEESARYFADQLNGVLEKFPAMTIHIVAHSMGGLVARAYIEGSDYHGGVDRLILVGTPNAGSTWAAGQFLLKIGKQYHDRKQDPHWHWTWAITEGLGEAGRDLTPGSKFLEHLNSLPRRAGVRYTIVAGDQTPANRYSAEVANATVHVIPKRASKWWGVRQCAAAVEKCGEHFRRQTSNSDGPVTLRSAQLAGVSDVAIVRADHSTLICPDHGNAPAAWPVIRDRLKDTLPLKQLNCIQTKKEN